MNKIKTNNVNSINIQITQLNKQLKTLQNKEKTNKTQFISIIKKILKKEIKELKSYIKNKINIQITATLNFNINTTTCNFFNNKVNSVYGYTNITSDNHDFNNLKILFLDDNLGNINSSSVNNFTKLHPETKNFVTHINKIIKNILTKTKQIEKKYNYQNVKYSISDLIH